MTDTTTQWTSRFAFLMAAIGSAVGLGNLWRFPFQAGENGGAAFVFIYLFCVVFVAYPVLVAELTLGRSKGMSAVGSTRQLAVDRGKSKRWSMVGWAGPIGRAHRRDHLQRRRRPGDCIFHDVLHGRVRWVPFQRCSASG